MGVFEQTKGKIKEAVGDLTDNDTLRREGEAQQEKGEEERRADVHAAKAKVHEKKADAAESEI